MGCYDMVFLEMECPYCKRTSEIECQTKDIDQQFKVYKKDDTVPEEFKDLEYLECIGDCHSPECQEKSDKSFIISQGSPSGFGLTFYIKIKLDCGVVTREIFDIKIDEDLDNHLNENRNKWEKIYKPRKKDNLVLKQFKEVK